MSMSEFNRRTHSAEDDSSQSEQEQFGLPDDFSEEDLAFARELDSLFALDDEEMPPYFVQTLLEADQPRYQAVEHGFEVKTRARVFRRLHLRRSLFRSQKTAFLGMMKSFPTHRPSMLIVTVCLVFMMLTMMATSNAFASGVAILWAGTHSGVIQIHSLPEEIAHPKSQSQSDNDIQYDEKQVSLSEAQQRLKFTMHWPYESLKNYTISEVRLYEGANQNWSDGPILQLNFDFAKPGVKAAGSGRLTIFQFKPQGNVLQVVGEKASETIDTHNKEQEAIFVDGQWLRISKTSYQWIYGTRSELIYEENGIVFWIVGDQNDGISKNELLKIAASVKPINVRLAINLSGGISDHVNTVTLATRSSSWFFTGDLVYVQSAVGSSWSVVKEDVHPLLVKSRTADS